MPDNHHHPSLSRTYEFENVSVCCTRPHKYDRSIFEAFFIAIDCLLPLPPSYSYWVKPTHRHQHTQIEHGLLLPKWSDAQCDLYTTNRCINSSSVRTNNETVYTNHTFIDEPFNNVVHIDLYIYYTLWYNARVAFGNLRHMRTHTHTLTNK